LQTANANDINTMPAADGPGNYLFICGLCHFQLAQDLRPAEIRWFSSSSSCFHYPDSIVHVLAQRQWIYAIVNIFGNTLKTTQLGGKMCCTDKFKQIRQIRKSKILPKAIVAEKSADKHHHKSIYDVRRWGLPRTSPICKC